LIVRSLEKAVEITRMASKERNATRYFCPIWQGEEQDAAWWMTFNQNTYSADLLTILGGENIFSRRERRYPLTADLGIGIAEPAGKRDIRYPRVRPDEIAAETPEVLIFPDEPYEFADSDKSRMVEILTAANGTAPAVHFIDGSLITWPGTRMGKALAELSELFPD